MAIINIHKIKSVFGLMVYAFGKYRFKLLAMILLGSAAGMFGAIGISAVIPLFAFATNQGISETDFISQTIEKTFSIVNIPYTLPFLLVLMVSLFVAKAIILFLANYINAKIAAQYEEDTRQDLFKRTIHTNWPHLMDQKLGYLERVIMNDIYNSASILVSISGVILLGTSLGAYIIVALNISSSITFITLGAGGLIFFLLKPFFYKTRKQNQKLADKDKAATHHISESMLGAKTIKSMLAENQVIQKASIMFEELRHARVKVAFYQYLMGSLMEPTGFVFIALIFLFSYKSPGFNIASFAAIVYLVQKMFSFIQSIQGKLNGINSQIPYLKVITDYKKDAIQNKEIDIGTIPFNFSKTLELKNVNFAYDTNNAVLSRASLSIDKGEMVGFIGPSGAGKTTLVDLLLRFLNPSGGEILLDNKNITEIDLKDWRANIGYVSQDIFLLNDTIENNIKFYDNSISKNDLIKYSKMANIYNFIQKFPKKFETTVGERGLKLSGGQRQRIILARALARKPSILILDEATSALDNESEIAIQKSIKNLRGKVTVIAIAHRLSTIMDVDKLIVLEKGRITETGSPDKLLRDKGSYFYKVYKIREG